MTAPPGGPKKRRKDAKKTKEIIVPDEPRLLHRNPGMGKSDYTDKLHMAADVREVPEPVDGQALEDIQARARANFSVIHAEQEARREMKSLRAKLAEAQARALKKGVDITPEVARLHDQVDEMRRKLDEAA